MWQHVVRRRSLHHSRATDEHSGLEDHVRTLSVCASRGSLHVLGKEVGALLLCGGLHAGCWALTALPSSTRAL